MGHCFLYSFHLRLLVGFTFITLNTGIFSLTQLHVDGSTHWSGLRIKFCDTRAQNPSLPRQQKINEMNGAHLVSQIRGELGYAHWPQLGTQFIALLGTKFGPH